MIPPLILLRRAIACALPAAFTALITSVAAEARRIEPADTAVSFRRDIAPILVQKCQTCHGPDRTKGGYRIDTFELLAQGGESELPAIVAGRPDQSRLFQLIAAEDDLDRMPQKDDPLPPAQVDLIRRWIEAGAEFDGEDRAASLVSIVPKEGYPSPPQTYAHPMPVKALALRPDGKELAVGGYHEVTIWDPENGRLLRRISGIAQRTQCLAYHPDGSLLAAATGAPGQFGEVVLCDPALGRVVRTFGMSPEVVLSVCFSPDGARLAAGGGDNSIHIFAVESGREEITIQQHADWVLGLAFSGDGSQIASASRDRSARVYDVATGSLVTTYTGHDEPVFDVAFAADGKQIYSGGRGGEIHFWTVAEGKKTAEIDGFEGDIFRLIATGEQLFVCAADRSVRQYSTANRKLIRRYSGHADWVYALALHEPTGRLISGSHDGRVRIWNLANGQLMEEFVASPLQVAGQAVAVPEE